MTFINTLKEELKKNGVETAALSRSLLTNALLALIAQPSPQCTPPSQLPLAIRSYPQRSLVSGVRTESTAPACWPSSLLVLVPRAPPASGATTGLARLASIDPSRYSIIYSIHNAAVDLCHIAGLLLVRRCCPASVVCPDQLPRASFRFVRPPSELEPRSGEKANLREDTK